MNSLNIIHIITNRYDYILPIAYSWPYSLASSASSPVPFRRSKAGAEGWGVDGGREMVEGGLGEGQRQNDKSEKEMGG